MTSSCWKDLKIDRRSGYDITDVVRLILLTRGKPAGRTALMKKLHLGEATVKTMMSFLKAKGLIVQDTLGVMPTKKCNDVFSFEMEMSEMEMPEFSKKPTTVLRIKKAAGHVKNGIKQRDAGVKFDSSIMTTIIRKGEIVVPGLEDHSLGYLGKVKDRMEPGDGDVIILSSAESKAGAEKGAVAAALTLFE